MDNVKLKVHNKLTNEIYIKDYEYDRTMLEKWLRKQRDDLGAQFFEWEILELTKTKGE